MRTESWETPAQNGKLDWLGVRIEIINWSKCRIFSPRFLQSILLDLLASPAKPTPTCFFLASLTFMCVSREAVNSLKYTSPLNEVLLKIIVIIYKCVFVVWSYLFSCFGTMSSVYADCNTMSQKLKGIIFTVMLLLSRWSGKCWRTYRAS